MARQSGGDGMRWFGWFRSAVYQGGALSNADEGEQHNRPPPRTTSANVSVTDERAMGVSTVFACTRLITQPCSTLPLGFYTRTAEGREALPDDHYLVRLLKYKPNNFMNALEFRAAMYASRVLWGNAYAKIDRNAQGTPISLIPMKPEFMNVVRENSRLIYRYSTDSGTIEFNQDAILHLKGWSTDGVVGLSPLGFAAHSLGLSVVAEDTAGKSIGGNASAVLELDEMPTDAQKEKLREMYGAGNVTTAYQNDGGLTIVPGGMKYRAISMNPDDLQLLESRQFSVIELARFFGVPSVLIDGSGSSTGSWPASYEQQMQSFLTFTLSTYLNEFEKKVTDSLIPESDMRKIYVEHKVDGLLRSDSAGRSAFYAQALGNTQQDGFMTVAEVRQKENLPHLDGTDELRTASEFATQGQNNAE